MDINFSNEQTQVPPPASPAVLPDLPPSTSAAQAPTTSFPINTSAAVAVAVRQTTALGPTGLVLGDKIPDFKDIILPRINLVQNIGELKETFVSGSVVLGRQTVVFSPPGSGFERDSSGALKPVDRPASPPMIFVVLGFRPTRYSEKVVGGVQGLTVNTEKEVLANGGTLDYKEWDLKKAAGMTLFQPLADAMIAVKRPDGCADDDTVFGYEVEGDKYALALWALKGTAYTEAAKRVFFTGRAVGVLRQGYPTYRFSLATKEKAYPNGNKAWVPVCLPLTKTTPVFLDFVRSVLSAPAVEESAD